MIHRNSKRAQSGFSMTEMLIVVSVLAIIATVAVPNFIASKVIANENAVLATLRKISTAELLFRESRFVDVNGNGWGEFGFLGELSGSGPMRGSGEYLQPPVLNPSFGSIDALGIGERHGYLFRVHLPDNAGVGVPETPDKVGTVNADFAAQFVTVVAWPKSQGKTGHRTFFMNQQGEIHSTVDTSYSGPNGAPLPNCGLVGVAAGVITTNSIATNGEVGVDGNRWNPVR